ncbi:b850488e-4392-46c5-a07e-793179103345 [Thermothielavioides terrestris]|uniref:B850488e-4392-46c5-a07e-793179103345 n=1 Tax=Thermothielavioides terrestris TaxID=2587410 RepID=A0A446BRK4_9PEZI|nr:b850488e-4392-46c5-a07e-793179103345 [Thermothielavioides terrestris]
MASAASSPQREPTPSAAHPAPPPGTPPAIPSILPQKRALGEDHSPAVSSPLNPESKAQRVQVQIQDDGQAMGREKRTKKDSLKKRESKGATDSARATPDPKPKEPAGELAPMRYKLAQPKPTDFEPSRGPVFASHHEVQDPDGKTIEFCETLDHVYNKKNFHYTHCIADPAFPSMFYYRNTEPPPYGAHMSFEDAASHMFFDRAGKHVTSDKGFRMSRANVAVREGRWYWECRITRGILANRGEGDPESHGHVRVGFARREASLDAPVGFDAYSYGIRDVAGQKVHMSRPKDFFPPGEQIQEGDVIGLEIQLPSERLHRKVVQGQYNPAIDAADEDSDLAPEAPDIIRDRIPIRFKAHIYFEKIDYHTSKELEDLMNPSGHGHSNTEPPNPNHPLPALRTLPNSYIKVYKNGVLMGTPWTDLLAFLPPASRQAQQSAGREALDDGTLGYYPAVSVFRGGAVEVNFGPDFWFPPPAPEDAEMQGVDGRQNRLGKLRAVSERYDEQIVEDIVYDIVDEVGFWMEDGGQVIDRSGRDEKAGEAVAPGREEIKELVQDD